MYSLKLQTLWTRDNVIGTHWTTKNNNKQINANKLRFLPSTFYYSLCRPSNYLYILTLPFSSLVSHIGDPTKILGREPFSPGAILDMPLHLAKDRTNCMEHGGITTSVSPTPTSLHWSIPLLTGARLPFITMQFTNNRHIEMIYHVGELISWDKWPRYEILDGFLLPNAWAFDWATSSFLPFCRKAHHPRL